MCGSGHEGEGSSFLILFTYKLCMKSGWENMHLGISTVTCCTVRHLTRPDPSLLLEDSLVFKLSGNYSSPVGLRFLPCLRIVSRQTNNA